MAGMLLPDRELALSRVRSPTRVHTTLTPRSSDPSESARYLRACDPISGTSLGFFFLYCLYGVVVLTQGVQMSCALLPHILVLTLCFFCLCFVGFLRGVAGRGRRE